MGREQPRCERIRSHTRGKGIFLFRLSIPEILPSARESSMIKAHLTWHAPIRTAVSFDELELPGGLP